MEVYFSSHELDGRLLKEGDELVFKDFKYVVTPSYLSNKSVGNEKIFSVKGDELVFKDFKYVVTPSYLSNKSVGNEKIFSVIGVEKYAFCKNAYRYESKTGGCPECNTGDYAALTRLAVAIFQKLEGSFETTYSSKPTSIMSNVLDFFRDLTATPNDKLLKELGIENPTNVPTELGLKLSQEITYAANRARIIEVAKQMKAEQKAKSE